MEDKILETCRYASVLYVIIAPLFAKMKTVMYQSIETPPPPLFPSPGT